MTKTYIDEEKLIKEGDICFLGNIGIGFLLAGNIYTPQLLPGEETMCDKYCIFHPNGYCKRDYHLDIECENENRYDGKDMVFYRL